MKLRASTKIALSALLLGGVAYGGSKLYTIIRLQGVELTPVEPTDFCLVAIGKGAPVKVITANHIAQLVEVAGGLENQGSEGGGAESGAIKRRIPVKEMLGILAGDSDSVAPMIEKLRTTTDDDGSISDETPVWTLADVEKALDGDVALKSRLENDLSTKVDGTPIRPLNLNAFYNGIAIKIPIELKVPNAKGATIKGFDIVSFRPRFMIAFYKSMREKFFDKQSIQNFYNQFLLQDQNAVYPSLKTLISGVKSSALNSEQKLKIEQIAGVSTILINRSNIVSAEMMEDKSGKEPTYDMKLRLDASGQKRLWKFSSGGGEKLLVISKGVPIASATLGSELNGEELVIKQIAERKLVVEAIETLQK
jgi:hypothetical protein